MLFSSVTFLYYFLPAVLLLYFLAPKRGRNLLLLLASLFFYAWPAWRDTWRNDYLVLILGLSAAGWLFGFLIDRYRGTKKGRVALIASITVSLSVLAVFKYADFLIENINRLVLGIQQPDQFAIGLLGLALPIGISFYTFQILSYSIDLYQGKVALQKNFIKFATYVAMFPQLIAGPIVRYGDIEGDLNRQRKMSLDEVGQGASRFTIGLGKKVLIANALGQLCQLYKDAGEVTILFTWLYLIAFALQIYFDFSGYSDMAIGLGRIFGFRFPENFRYPYMAASVTDFWRRWHISLGSWFRDYVYIPLGGNRKGIVSHIRNIFIVWFLTGLWHGAGWNFIAWGLYFGALLLLEKYLIGNWLKKLPKGITRGLTLLAVLISWMFFDSTTLTEALHGIGALFGMGVDGLTDQWSLYYLRSYGILLLVAILGATPLPKYCYEKALETREGERVMTFLQPLALAALLLLCTAYLVDGSFNPFIYLQF